MSSQSPHHYKKSKIEQLQSFCTVVESGFNITHAAEKLNLSPASVSTHIQSLEYEVELKLFDRIKGRLHLTIEGKSFYQEAKKVLLDLNKIYNGKIGIIKVSKFEVFLLKARDMSVHFMEKFSEFINTIILKVTWKRFFISLIVAISLILFYLDKTNWFFDRKLHRYSTNTLAILIKDGAYRIDKTDICPFNSMQMILDWNALAKKVCDNYSDTVITLIASSECPNMPERMNGDDEYDNLINDPKVIKCDTQNRFMAQKQRYSWQINMMNNHDNFKSYNFYRNTDCFHMDAFFSNLDKYNGKIFAKHVINSTGIPDGSHFIMKHKKYYYLFAHTNALQSHNIDKPQDKYFIWKKLTLDQLMTYDNGSYWRVITKYNIQIN